MKVYKSKLGLEFIIPITIVLAWILYQSILDKKWMITISCLMVAIFISHMFYTTEYRIEKGNLKIKCGFFLYSKIEIQTIRKISDTNDASSSPATSIDRLEIRFDKYKTVLVSPKDKKGFIDSLLEVNPSIEVECRKKESKNYS